MLDKHLVGYLCQSTCRKVYELFSSVVRDWISLEVEETGNDMLRSNPVNVFFVKNVIIFL